MARKAYRRPLIIGWGIGLLVLALIAPLVAGLLPNTGDDVIVGGAADDQDRDGRSSPTDNTVGPTGTVPTDPALTDPEFAGASLTGPTPCPRIDGDQERVTSFETAPPMCIDTALEYTMTLEAPTGSIEIEIAADAAPTAANLAVTLARYGAYDRARTWHMAPMAPGFVLIGGDGDAGFVVEAEPGEAPFSGRYPVGAVIMFTITGEMQGQLGIVTTSTAGDALARYPIHPIVGHISDGFSEAAEALVGAGISRLDAVTVTEHGSAPEVTAPDTPPDTISDDPPQGCPATDGTAPRTLTFDGPHPMCIDPGEVYVAVFDTTEGEIEVALDTQNTPATVNNFVTLARWGYYDGTTIFRTDPGIDIIQGGAPHTDSPTDPGPGYTIPDEPQSVVDPDTEQLKGPYRYEPGQLAMARTAAPDSAGAQYFFSTGPNTSRLDSQGTYVVFGRTDPDGLAVLRSIIDLHEPHPDWGGTPSRPVTVRSVTIGVR